MFFVVTALGSSPSSARPHAVLLGFTLGLLLTFLAVRVNTRLIRAQVSWWFHDITPGGTHIHHMVFGVIIMVVTGLLAFALAPTGLTLQVLAFVFGAGVALTLDEFALILHLEDVYWSRRAASRSMPSWSSPRRGALSLLVGPPLVGTDVGKGSVWSGHDRRGRQLGLRPDRHRQGQAVDGLRGHLGAVRRPGRCRAPGAPELALGARSLREEDRRRWRAPVRAKHTGAVSRAGSGTGSTI